MHGLVFVALDLAPGSPSLDVGAGFACVSLVFWPPEHRFGKVALLTINLAVEVVG
jgi:hypothetical protein